MRWLVTVKNQPDLQELDRDLSSIGCQRIADKVPIPLGEKEVVIEVEAPETFLEQFNQRLKNNNSQNQNMGTEIIQINVSSELHLY